LTANVSLQVERAGGCWFTIG